MNNHNIDQSSVREKPWNLHSLQTAASVHRHMGKASSSHNVEEKDR